MIYIVQEQPAGMVNIGSCRRQHLGGRLRVMREGNPRPLTLRARLSGGAKLRNDLVATFDGDVNGWCPPRPKLVDLLADAEGLSPSDANAFVLARLADE